MVRILLEKINHINSINHKTIRNCPEPPSAGRIINNQPNALTPALDNLNVVWFQFFMILNKIDRLLFTKRKAQFV